jgi:hypothetical protein
MQPNGNATGRNGLYQNGAPGGTQPDPVTQSDALDQDYLSFDEDGENGKTFAEEQQPPRNRSRRRWVGATIFFLVLIVAGTVIWTMFGGGKKTRINVPVRDNAQRTDQATARNNDDVTAQAIAEVRTTTASPTPALSASPAPVSPAAGAGTIIMPTTPVTIPMEGVTVSPAARPGAGEGDASARNAVAAGREEPASRRNSERSIRCAPIPTPIPANKLAADTTARTPSPEPAMLQRPDPRVVLPSFGAMLPVRTLGAISTLRPSLTRFELVRDLRGDNWQLKRGTIIVGRQQGSEYDRAYVSLDGFIDPESKRFVRLTGEVLGDDGAQGLKGKRRRISGRLASVLNRAITTGTALGQAALSRGNSTTVVLPGAVGSEATSNLIAVNRREFVEVPAGTPGYLLMTALPKEAKGLRAEDLSEIMNGNGALTDGEVFSLLESGSPEQIRAALPRMSPQLRQIAELVLKEPGK